MSGLSFLKREICHSCAGDDLLPQDYAKSLRKLSPPIVSTFSGNN